MYYMLCAGIFKAKKLREGGFLSRTKAVMAGKPKKTEFS